MSDGLRYDLDGLAVDVFTLERSGAKIESLTGTRDTELIASACSCSCSGMCSLIK